MHIWRKAFVAPVDSVGQSLSRFWRDLTAAATIEFIFLTPVILTMIGLVVAGGEGFELNRKITMVVRTLADLASQQTNIGTSSSTYTYTQLLNAASLVIQPYDSSQLSLVLSEVSANGAGTGVVKWSQGNTAAVANSSAKPKTICFFIRKSPGCIALSSLDGGAHLWGAAPARRQNLCA